MVLVRGSICKLSVESNDIGTKPDESRSIYDDSYLLNPFVIQQSKTFMKKINSFLLLLISIVSLQAQEIMPLYRDSIPGSGEAISQTDTPTITAYLPAKGTSKGTGIIIFPGGAYAFLATELEGTPIAKGFVQQGIAAFVVKYRLPNSVTMRDKSMGPLMDAQQAMKLVKLRWKEWNLDTNKVGIIGFSAGGHLAAMLGTHNRESYIPNPEGISLHPAFMILVYPVISMHPGLTHIGSRNNLIGNNPDPVKEAFFSGEECVSLFTPPTYITHAGDDKLVTVENSVAFYHALLKEGIEAELHLYPIGDHGFVLHLPVNEWLDPMLLFLKKRGWY